MRKLKVLLAAASAALALASHVTAKPITSPNDITVSTTQVNFEELKSKDNKAFGSAEVGQPYSTMGLVLPSQVIDANVVVGEKQKVGIKSTGVSTVDNASYQSVAFTRPQRVVAFAVKSERATTIRVTAMDRKGTVLDEVEIKPSSEPQFVGFMYKDPQITVVRVVAPHATMADALSDPTVITDVTFAALAEESGTDGVAGAQGYTSDFGLAQAVGSTGANLSAMAMAGGGGGVSGAGASSASNGGAGRNPGNRNPNLPPQSIPEPATLLIGAPAMALLSVRRRRA